MHLCGYGHEGDEVDGTSWRAAYWTAMSLGAPKCGLLHLPSVYGVS